MGRLNSYTMRKGVSAGSKLLALKRVRSRAQRSGSPGLTSGDAIKAVVEGFAFSRNSGNISVSLSQDDDRSGSFVVEMKDMSQKAPVPGSAMFEEQVSLPVPESGLANVGDLGIPKERDVVPAQDAHELIRENEEMAQILASGDMLSLIDFSHKMALDRDEILRRVRNGEILGLKGVSHRYKFPSWQCVHKGPGMEILPGLPELISLAEGNHWTVYRFLSSKCPDARYSQMWRAMRDGLTDEMFNLWTAWSQK